jgi:membrane protein
MIADLKVKLDNIIWGDALYHYGLAGRVVAGVLRNLYAVIRDIVSGQLTLRSMSLVYTTLLSVVPLIAFSFSVLKGLGVHKNIESRLYAIVEPLGDKGTEIAENIMRLVNNVNGSVLGGIGLAFFIYTAISMVQKIEESFNYVWYVTKPRSFSRRFTEYMLILLLGPLAIAIVLGTLASLENEAIVQWAANSPILSPVFSATSRLTPFLVVTATFTALYKYMPNTEVHLRSALVGGLAGGFLWSALAAIFAAFIANSARTQAIYASFAITITTLMWLYLNWLILLIGSQLAFYFQNPAYIRIGRRNPRLSNAMRERLSLNIMLIVGTAFRDSNKWITQRALSEQLRIPSITVAPIVQALQDNGLLTLTEQDELLPGRDIARIKLTDIIDVVREKGETGSYRDPKWSLVVDRLGGSIDSAVDATLGDKFLSDLLDETEEN